MVERHGGRPVLLRLRGARRHLARLPELHRDARARVVGHRRGHRLLGAAGPPRAAAPAPHPHDDLRARLLHRSRADPVTLHWSWRIVTSTLRRRSCDEAPVSPLFLFGRQQDFAYQQEVDGSPEKRHHVRLWRCPRVGVEVLRDFSTGYHSRNGGGDTIRTDGDLPIVDVREVTA
ncbi:LssY C-terminal domain-containing protein [Microbacterium lacticum]